MVEQLADFGLQEIAFEGGEAEHFHFCFSRFGQAGDDACQGASGAAGHGPVRRLRAVGAGGECGMGGFYLPQGFKNHFLYTFYGELIGAAFGDEVEGAVFLSQFFYKGAFSASAIFAAGDEYGFHATGFDKRECVVERLDALAAYDGYALQPERVYGIGGGVEVVGIGPAESEQSLLAEALHPQQIVFELAPLVARKLRVDEVFPLDETLDARPLGSLYAERLKGGGEV